ncbi:DUF5320 domain-containing protein [candidate division KSB1 bacterium]|nr:DUF5320 domain-containing protein [candidate division KSB1 bacterium]
MPRGDGSGPNGMGLMTGRAAGFCAGYQMPGYANPVAGRGFGGGFGRGMGLGFRRGRSFNPNFGFGYAQNAMPFGIDATPQQEIEALQSQSKGLEDTLNQINKRITELENEKTGK